MFKGIQKSTLLLSLLMLVSPASYANQADRASDEMTSSSSSSGAAASTRVAYDEGDLLSKKMKGCENTAGSYNRMVGEPRTTVISETATEKIEEVCQRVECAYTVGDGGGSFDFGEPSHLYIINNKYLCMHVYICLYNMYVYATLGCNASDSKRRAI